MLISISPVAEKVNPIKHYKKVKDAVLRFDTLYYVQMQVSVGLGPCEDLDDEIKMEVL